MPRVVRSDRARRDLSSIWNYVAEQRNELQADMLLRRIVGTLGTLAASPGIGRLRDDLRPNLRSFPVQRYIIYYYPLTDGIHIMRMLHGSRDITTIFENEETDEEAEE